MISDKPYEVPAYLLERCKLADPVSTAVVGADNVVAMESARHAMDEGMIIPVLIGEADHIKSIATDIGWDLAGIRIEDAPGESKAPLMATELARGDEVGAIMKGHIHTDALMSAIVKRDAGLRTDRKLSHTFHMTVPGSDRTLLITDGAVNIAPNVKTKIHIIKNAVEIAHALGNKCPKVAMLSGTESVLPAMASSVEAEEIVKMANSGEVSGAIVDGPFAFDNAISPEASRIKGIDSPVAGHADILIVPNIETGNSLFKMMVHFMSATAAGVVMGAKVPVMLTSRADPIEARVASAALAVLVAHHQKDSGKA